MRVLLLKNRQGVCVGFTSVSDADYERCRQYSWHRQGAGYAHASINGKKVLLHRFILPEAELVDHIDRNKLNNTRENLRASDKSLNAINRGAQSNSKSGIVGVSFDTKKELWIAQMKKRDQRRYSWHKTQEEAVKRRLEYEKELG